MEDKLTERLKKLDVTILAAKDLLGAMKEQNDNNHSRLSQIVLIRGQCRLKGLEQARKIMRGEL